MPRVRVSATVDGERLRRARELTGARDSQLLDDALAALLQRLVAEHEQAALLAEPYHEDPDLKWTARPAAALPYEGDVPADVAALARTRRERR